MTTGEKIKHYWWRKTDKFYNIICNNEWIETDKCQQSFSIITYFVRGIYKIELNSHRAGHKALFFDMEGKKLIFELIDSKKTYFILEHFKHIFKEKNDITINKRLTKLSKI